MKEKESSNEQAQSRKKYYSEVAYIQDGAEDLSEKEETSQKDAPKKDWVIFSAMVDENVLAGVPASQLISEARRNEIGNFFPEDPFSLEELRTDPAYNEVAEDENYIVSHETGEIPNDYILFKKITEREVRDMLRQNGYSEKDSRSYAPSLADLAHKMREEDREAADDLQQKYSAVRPKVGDVFPASEDGKEAFVVDKIGGQTVSGRLVPSTDLTKFDVPPTAYTPLQLQYMRNAYYERQAAGNPKEGIDTHDNPNVYYAYIGDMYPEVIRDVYKGIEDNDASKLISSAVKFDKYEAIDPEYVYKDKPSAENEHFPQKFYEGERYAVNVVSNREQDGVLNSYAGAYVKMTDREVVENFRLLTDGDERLARVAYDKSVPEVRELLDQSGINIPEKAVSEQAAPERPGEHTTGNGHAISHFVLEIPSKDNPDVMDAHVYDTTGDDLGHATEEQLSGKAGLPVIRTTREDFEKYFEEGRKVMSGPLMPQGTIEKPEYHSTAELQERNTKFISQRLGMIEMGHDDANVAQYSGRYARDVIETLGKQSKLTEMWREGIEPDYYSPEGKKDKGISPEEASKKSAEKDMPSFLKDSPQLPEDEEKSVTRALRDFAADKSSSLKFYDGGESAMSGSHSYSFHIGGKSYDIVVNPSEDFAKYYGRNSIRVRRDDELTDMTAGNHKLSEAGYDSIADAAVKAGEYVKVHSKEMEQMTGNIIRDLGTDGRLELLGDRPTVNGMEISSVGMSGTWEGKETVHAYGITEGGEAAIPWSELSFDERKAVAGSVGYTAGRHIADAETRQRRIQEGNYVSAEENRSHISETPSTGKWHNYVLNELRVYQRYGEILTDWKNSHDAGKFHSGMYSVPGSDSVKALVFSAFSETHDLTIPLYLSAKEIDQSGLKVEKGAPSVPVFDKATGKIEDYYNIGQTDHLRLPPDSPVRQTYTKMAEDAILFRHEGSRYLQDAGKLANDGHWVVPVEKVSMKPEGSTAVYDLKDDIIRISDTGVKPHEVLSALTDSLLIGDRIKQQHPHDSNYQSFAALMNDIRYNTPYGQDGQASETEQERVPFFSTGNSRSEFIRFRDDPVYTKDILDTAARTSDAIYMMSQGQSVDDLLDQKDDVSVSEPVKMPEKEEHKEEVRRPSGFRMH